MYAITVHVHFVHVQFTQTRRTFGQYTQLMRFSLAHTRAVDTPMKTHAKMNASYKWENNAWYKKENFEHYISNIQLTHSRELSYIKTKFYPIQKWQYDNIWFFLNRISMCEDMDRRCISFVRTNKDILHDTCVKEDRAEHSESQFPKYNFWSTLRKRLRRQKRKCSCSYR